MPYTFYTTLLSAAKTSNPSQPNALSANGVSIVSLSTNDVGISFTPISTLSGVLSSLTVDGSVFLIDTIYSGQKFSLNKFQINNLSQHTVFTYLSSLATTPVSGYDLTPQVSTPGSRRLRLYGYR